MTGVRFSPDGQIAFFSENNATVAVFLNDPTQKYTIARGGGGGAAGRGGNALVGKVEVVALREILPNLEDLGFHEVEVVQHPFRGGRDRGAPPDVVR